MSLSAKLARQSAKGTTQSAKGTTQSAKGAWNKVATGGSSAGGGGVSTRNVIFRMSGRELGKVKGESAIGVFNPEDFPPETIWFIYVNTVEGKKKEASFTLAGIKRLTKLMLKGLATGQVIIDVTQEPSSKNNGQARVIRGVLCNGFFFNPERCDHPIPSNGKMNYRTEEFVTIGPTGFKWYRSKPTSEFIASLEGSCQNIAKFWRIGYDFEVMTASGKCVDTFGSPVPSLEWEVKGEGNTKEKKFLKTSEGQQVTEILSGIKRITVTSLTEADRAEKKEKKKEKRKAHEVKPEKNSEQLALEAEVTKLRKQREQLQTSCMISEGVAESLRPEIDKISGRLEEITEQLGKIVQDQSRVWEDPVVENSAGGGGTDLTVVENSAGGGGTDLTVVEKPAGGGGSVDSEGDDSEEESEGDNPEEFDGDLEVDGPEEEP